MKFSFKIATIYFLLAYIIVTILAYGSSYAVGTIFKLPTAEELGVSLFEDPAFVKTVPLHLLINLVCWTWFGYRYFKRTGSMHLGHAYALSTYWLMAALLVDLIAFVLIKSPVSLTPQQFYIEYQPWITITYAIVFISPLIAQRWMRKKLVAG